MFRLMMFCFLPMVFWGCAAFNQTSSNNIFDNQHIYGEWTTADQRWIFFEDGSGYMEFSSKNTDVKLDEKFLWELEDSRLSILSDNRSDAWYVDDYKIEISGKKKKVMRLKSKTDGALIKLEKK